MSDIEKRIGGKIKEIRLSKKLTQAQLAEKINVSVESISRLERGATFPSLKTMEKLAVSMNSSLKSFFDFDKNKAKDLLFENELAKLTGFLRTLSVKEIRLVYEILKAVFKNIKRLL